MKKLITFALCLAFAANVLAADNWECTHTLEGQRRDVELVEFSPDGTQLAQLARSSKDATLQIWSTTNGELLHTLRLGWIHGIKVTINPDGSYIATASDDDTGLWDKSDKLLKKLKGYTYLVNSVLVNSVKCPDGSCIATTQNNRTVQIVNSTNGELLKTLTTHTGSPVYAVAFNPDGTLLLAVSRGGIEIWDARNGKLVQTLTGYTGRVLAVAFNPDDTLLLIISHNGIEIWVARNGKLVQTSIHTKFLHTLAFSPDGSYIATAPNDGIVQIWDARNCNLQKTLTGRTGSAQKVVFSPDNLHIATVSGDGRPLELWNTKNGKLLETIPKATYRDCVADVAFSPNGSQLATASWDGTVRLWLNSGVVRKNAQLRQLAFTSAIHPRLGENSPASVLPRELVAEICGHIGRSPAPQVPVIPAPAPAAPRA